MIGPLGRLGAAATLGQHCPQMTQRPGTWYITVASATQDYIPSSMLRCSRTRPRGAPVAAAGNSLSSWRWSSATSSASRTSTPPQQHLHKRLTYAMCFNNLCTRKSLSLWNIFHGRMNTKQKVGVNRFSVRLHFMNQFAASHDALVTLDLTQKHGLWPTTSSMPVLR